MGTANALHGVAAGGSEVIKPELGCEADQILIRDAPCPEACRENAEGPGLHRETKGAPDVHYQKEKDVDITLHVDDFLLVVEEEHLLKLKMALEKVYKLKGKVLGPDKGDSKEGVYLER